MSSGVLNFGFLFMAVVLTACADRFASSKYTTSESRVSDTATFPQRPVPARIIPVKQLSPKTDSPVPIATTPAENYVSPGFGPLKLSIEPEVKSKSIVFKKNAPAHPEDRPENYQPLLWEKGKAETVMWSSYALQIIGDQHANSFLSGAKDVEEFCPRYSQLSRAQKINFWAYLISAIAKFESSFDPTDRMVEKAMGIDPVTQKQVVSEGLLQLSYQDMRGRSAACDFDWSNDRNMHVEDPRKTILDPFKNLKCGISILANQVRSRQMISIYEGGYWSVLRPEGYPYSKVSQIKKLTHQLSFCVI